MRIGETFRSRVVICLLLTGLFGCSGQPLEPWHKTHFDEEFSADMAGDEVAGFADYLALEDRLFAELRETVYTQVATGPEYALVRYSAGSAADPETREGHFNRSFELDVEEPVGGLLLLHGMSDSPYSLRALGEKAHAGGFQVLALRLPGHGTAPSELKHIRWRDMDAAVRLAMMHLAEKAGDVPLHIAGYSTGAPLALNYALDALDDTSLVKPASLILVSPAIGISAAAAMARPIAAAGRVPGFRRLGWSSVQPEFDPYKYNSFTTNAASQVRQLTQSVSSRIASLASTERAAELPPMLVFKSVVDATVTTDAVVSRLLERLPDNGNELYLFDVNRSAVTSTIIVDDPGPLTDQLMSREDLSFSIRLLTNENTESRAVVEQLKPPYALDVADTTITTYEWPRGVLSLSHVALPFSPEDALYGAHPPVDESKLFLGQMALRGERGMLRISTDWLLRIRFNPFYGLMERRAMQWLEQTQ